MGRARCQAAQCRDECRSGNQRQTARCESELRLARQDGRHGWNGRSFMTRHYRSRRRPRLWISTLFAVSLVVPACSHQPERSRVTLATTTSVGNSGLLDALLPVFEREAGIQVRPLLVGSGRALQMLVSGQADVAFTHAPEAEAATLDGRTGWLY